MKFWVGNSYSSAFVNHQFYASSPAFQNRTLIQNISDNGIMRPGVMQT